MVSVNVTVNMPPEMLEDIDEEADKLRISRTRYIRGAIRNCTETPFDPDDIDLQVDDSDVEEAQKGAA